jgi:EAL domain-containing protein (putative c-di-GMP-specific phosphodiesterase class I)/GGDEF domain-containing protein
MRMGENLADALPDLVLLVRRDGRILSRAGGSGVPALASAAASVDTIDAAFSETAAGIIRQSVRRAIAQRDSLDVTFSNGGAAHEMRVTAKAPDRAICAIRIAGAGKGEDAAEGGDLTRPQFDRRGFLRRFNDTLSQAAIQERPAALAVIQIDGLADIARTVDAKVSEQVLSTAVGRLPERLPVEGARGEEARSPYLGQLGADLIALVIESSDRDAIESCVSSVCASLREPVPVGDAAFHLTPYAGAAILGQDGHSPKSLHDKARAAAAESRRSNANRLMFFTDTLRLRSLARLDVTRELREAVESRQIRLRYVPRHDLATGRLVAQVGYARWRHPLRGEISPAEFLGVAETTGLAPALSRALLIGLAEDFAAVSSELGADVHLSLGPLRHHMLQDDFVEDLSRFFGTSRLPASRFELRIAERTFTAMSPASCRSLGDLGIRIVVDEVGRGFTSLDRLASAPIWGLQLDRAWVTALRSDPVALRICRAGISAAAALGLTPIATGVDNLAQKSALLELGCLQGSGDLYGADAEEFDNLIMRRSSQAVA